MDHTSNKGGLIDWPKPIGGFPPSKLPIAQDAVFIRDLVDAMTAYFQYDLDDCIRKTITSLENCFSHYKLSLPSENLWVRIISLLRGRRTKLKKLINEYAKKGRYAYIERNLKILRKNILFVYRLRNLVVHDKLRINPSQTTVCRKAIGTLLYLYQGNFLSVQHRNYILSFHSQFISLYEQYSGYSLEIAEWQNKVEKKHPNIIKTPDDMNKFMFKNLRITDKEMKDTLLGKLEQHLPPDERA